MVVNQPNVDLKWAQQDKEGIEEVKAPNPQCTELVCLKEFWVPENGLCLYCGYDARKQRKIHLL